MFRTVPVSIIRSFSLYTQQWYVFYRFADSLRSAGSGRRYAVTVGPNEVGCLHWGRQCPVYKMHVSLWIQGDRHCVGIELHSLICKIIIKALDKSVSVYTLLHGTCFISLIHLVLLNLLEGSRCARDVTDLCSPLNPAVSWPNCTPRDAIQNRICQFRTSCNNNNNNNNKQGS